MPLATITSIEQLKRKAEQHDRGQYFKRCAQVLVHTASNFGWVGITSSECDAPSKCVEMQDLNDAAQALEAEAAKTGNEQQVLAEIIEVSLLYPPRSSSDSNKFVQDGLEGFPVVEEAPEQNN